MKTKIKKSFLLFLILAAALFASANLYAQNAPSLLGEPVSKEDYQVRLAALQLCYGFYQSVAADRIKEMDAQIEFIQSKLEGTPTYVHGIIENFIENHPNDALTKRYIRCQAVIALPELFEYKEDALQDMQAELLGIANQIAPPKQ